VTPEEEVALRKMLLKLVSSIMDLRFNTVQAVSKEIGIPTEQLNHILNSTIGKVKIDTILTIAHKAGKQVMVKIDD